MTRQTTSLNLSELRRDWRHSEGNIEIENQLEGYLQYKWNYVDPYFLKLSNTMICLHSDTHLTQLVNFFSCFKHWLTLRTTFHTFVGTKMDLVDVFLHGAMRSLLQAFSFSNDPFKRNWSKIKIHFLSQSHADLGKLQLLRRYMLQGASSSSFCPVWTLQEISLKCSGNFRNFDPGVLMLFPLAAILINSGISPEYHYLHSANGIEL